MKANHSVTLTEDDITRAIADYIAARFKVSDPREWQLDVMIQWRAKKAIVEARRKPPIPTLTNAVEEIELRPVEERA